MLQELLMCLLGNTGGLFQLKIENNIRKMKLIENLEYIHPSEIEICNKLAQLGMSYRIMEDFVQANAFAIIDNEKFGLYVTTFCDSLEEIVLMPYRHLIGELEKRLLEETYLNVTYLQSHLENHFILFTILCNLIGDIENKNAHGCQIIDLIYRCTLTGNEIIKETMNKILCVCHKALFKQLRDWLIYGQLNDKYSEFFICLSDKKAVAEPDAQTKNQDDELGIGGFTLNQLNEVEEMLMGGRFDSHTNSNYMLNALMFPSYLNLKTANKILFTGEALQLFKPKINDETRLVVSDDKYQSDKKALTSYDSNNALTNEINVMHENLHVYSRELLDLSREQGFSIVQFEQFIDRIRNYVSQSTWQIIVEKYDLPGELQKLKDMFLLNRGELFATFIDTAKQLLNKNVEANTEYHLNYFLQQSVSRMLLDNEPWISKFKLILNPENLEKSNSQNGWSRLGLSYEVEWPFYSLITPTVLNKYNEIFSFLLSIRRVQNELHQCFILQKSILHMKLTDFEPKVWLTRNNMSFLIDNLQFYLQADVLETQYMEMMNNIKISKDFEQIRFAHDTFLTKIQAQCFMLHKPVYTCLNEIVDICLSFCSMLNANGSAQNIPKDQFSHIIREFQIRTSVLYNTFKSLQKRQLGNHLEQLLTRINFNDYFAQNNGLLV